MHTPKKFSFIVYCLNISDICSTNAMVIEVKLAVTGMSAYDSDLRLSRPIPAGPVSQL